MKKILLILGVVIYAATAMAQEVEIFYPDFQYDTNKGFTKHNIVIGAAETDLWKRGTGGLPADSELGYTRAGNQTLLTSKGYGGNGVAYGITDTYAVVDGVNLSSFPQDKHFKVTFFNQAQYGLGNFAKFTVLLTENYTGDPTTTTWTDVTSQLDRIDEDVNYDSNWTKSTLNLNAWKSATNLVLAFRYQVEQAGTVNPNDPKDRPGLWRVCETRFTYSDTPTAIDASVKAKTVLFSPNPAKNNLTFNSRVVAYKIYSLSGQLVEQAAVSSPSANISQLQKGVYLLHMNLNDGTTVAEKLIKL